MTDDSSESSDVEMTRGKTKKGQKRLKVDEGTPDSDTQQDDTEPVEDDDEDGIDNEEDIYEVEAVLDKEIRDDDVYYLVSWKSYGSEFDTWEPATGLEDALELVEEWEKALSAVKRNGKAGTKAKTGKPRKTSKPSIKKIGKARPENPDPWGLTTPSVAKNWRRMKSPSLEMFYFTRVVVDEFTYLKQRDHTAIS